jgi:hypothetical protein
MDENHAPTNNLAIISFITALLTLISFCIGWAPFLVGSSLIGYPAAILLGLVALVTGVAALRRIHVTGERGRGMALTGAWLGGLTVLGVVCAVVITVSTVTAVVVAAINQLLAAGSVTSK